MRLLESRGQEVPADLFPQQGSLDGWKRVANMLFAVGCEAQSVMLLGSFAAPLMCLMKMTEGGALLSLWGGKRSGKDLAWLAARTVWGDWPMDDPAAMENLPVFLERLANRDPLSAKRYVVDLLAGHPHTEPWRTLFLSVSPIPLFPTLFAEGDILPGVELRVSVPPALIDKAQTRRLESALLHNRGHAGYAYLNYLLRDGVSQWCRKDLNGRLSELVDELGSPKENRFKLWTIAAIRTAAEIVSHMKLVDVDPTRIDRWLRDQAKGEK